MDKETAGLIENFGIKERAGKMLRFFEIEFGFGFGFGKIEIEIEIESRVAASASSWNRSPFEQS